jgi:hypothetical protein
MGQRPEKSFPTELFSSSLCGEKVMNRICVVGMGIMGCQIGIVCARGGSLQKSEREDRRRI